MEQRIYDRIFFPSSIGTLVLLYSHACVLKDIFLDAHSYAYYRAFVHIPNTFIYSLNRLGLIWSGWANAHVWGPELCGFFLFRTVAAASRSGKICKYKPKKEQGIPSRGNTDGWPRQYHLIQPLHIPLASYAGEQHRRCPQCGRQGVYGNTARAPSKCPTCGGG